jgi:hypothetical protein
MHLSIFPALLQGMSEDVSINRFFDDPMLLELVRFSASLHCVLDHYIPDAAVSACHDRLFVCRSECTVCLM